jgi:uncharacterized protein YndB with AHSA1/START domain
MTDMTNLTETLDREISICARRETVFAYFTDSDRFARWWGEGSHIDPRAGGEVFIHYPNGITAKGEIREIEPPRRIVFTYVSGGVPSLVTIHLEETDQGTLLKLHHAFSSAKIRDHFVQGWRYQLALFSKAVADEAQGDAAMRVDAFLRAWGEPDGNTRRALMESCAAPGIVFRDAYSATEGLDDLLANLDAVQLFMPGMTLVRSGDVRRSHGTAIAPWTAKKENGDPAGAGINVFDLSPDGRIARVVGFWDK